MDGINRIKPAKRAAEFCRQLRGLSILLARQPSAEALGYFRSSAGRTVLPAAMLTIVLSFLRSSFANFSLSLKRNQPASISLHFVNVGTMIRAPIACL